MLPPGHRLCGDHRSAISAYAVTWLLFHLSTDFSAAVHYSLLPTGLMAVRDLPMVAARLSLALLPCVLQGWQQWPWHAWAGC